MEFEFQLNDIGEAARQIASAAGACKVWAFDGEMGAGKTTQICAICGYLGVDGNFGSPTFSIINEYQRSSEPVYHIDLYRCKDEEEALRAGVEDCLYSGHLCLVEWPSRAPGIFPPDALRVVVTVVDQNTRRVSVQLSSNRSAKEKSLNRL